MIPFSDQRLPDTSTGETTSYKRGLYYSWYEISNCLSRLSQLRKNWPVEKIALETKRRFWSALFVCAISILLARKYLSRKLVVMRIGMLIALKCKLSFAQSLINGIVAGAAALPEMTMCTLMDDYTHIVPHLIKETTKIQWWQNFHLQPKLLPTRQFSYTALTLASSKQKPQYR